MFGYISCIVILWKEWTRTVSTITLKCFEYFLLTPISCWSALAISLWHMLVFSLTWLNSVSFFFYSLKKKWSYYTHVQYTWTSVIYTTVNGLWTVHSKTLQTQVYIAVNNCCLNFSLNTFNVFKLALISWCNWSIL